MPIDLALPFTEDDVKAALVKYADDPQLPLMFNHLLFLMDAAAMMHSASLTEVIKTYRLLDPTTGDDHHEPVDEVMLIEPTEEPE